SPLARRRARPSATRRATPPARGRDRRVERGRSPPLRSAGPRARREGRGAGCGLRSPAMVASRTKDVVALKAHRHEVLACRLCATVVGPPVIGPPIPSAIYAIGQAPGPHEAKKGRPFGHTAGKTLFSW